jgi:ABC-type dipeptide/oligopeptide/nickel transport system permease subunit
VSGATRSRGRQVLGAFLRTPTGIVSAVLLAAILALAIVGPPLFGGEAETVDVVRANEGPSAEHPLGTNALGQDILARTLAATRLSLLLALGATGLAALFGSVAGALIASAGPRLRRLGAGLIDATLSFGGILLAIFVVAALSFLGLGVQYPEYEWGALLSKGVQSFYVTPWAALAPAIMITITGAAFSLFGDALARASNPLLWGQRPRLLRSRGAPQIDYTARPEGSS